MTSKTSWRKHFLENAKNRIWALTVVSLLLFILGIFLLIALAACKYKHGRHHENSQKERE